MTLFAEFLFRLTLGLAMGLAVTSPRKVDAGFFRTHLYVLLGLQVVATLIALSPTAVYSPGIPAVGAMLSYVGSVFWLYQWRRPGRATLLAVAAIAMLGSCAIAGHTETGPDVCHGSNLLDAGSSGLVLGLPMAAMLLGHWYLNHQSMSLDPLWRLIGLSAGAVALRGIGCAVVLFWGLSSQATPDTTLLMMLALRWVAGIAAALVFLWMSWQTLKVPNTQSATGILYVCVIVTFLGELTSLLLASESTFLR